MAGEQWEVREVWCGVVWSDLSRLEGSSDGREDVLGNAKVEHAIGNMHIDLEHIPRRPSCDISIHHCFLDQLFFDCKVVLGDEVEFFTQVLFSSGE